jgi:hypothetical protein
MKKYTPEMRAFIKEQYEKGVRNKDICGMVNARFGTDFTENAIEQFMFRSGISHQKKIYPIGYESVNKDGYVAVKIAKGNPKEICWKLKHRLVWEREYGAIPERHAVVFLDGDKRNFALENLALLNQNEMARMNQLGFFSNDPTVTVAGIAVVKHLIAIHGRLEKMLGSKGHRIFINNASRKRQEKRIWESI